MNILLQLLEPLVDHDFDTRVSRALPAQRRLYPRSDEATTNVALDRGRDRQLFEVFVSGRDVHLCAASRVLKIRARTLRDFPMPIYMAEV